MHNLLNGTQWIDIVFRLLKILIITFVFISPSWAVEKRKENEPKHNPNIVQHNGFWSGLNVQNYLSENKRWVYLFNTQARFLDQTHPLKTVLVQDSIGYSFNKNQRVWMGYFYSGNNFRVKHFTENRLFQEYYWTIVNNQKTKVAYRVRFEENQYSEFRQNQVLFRQLLAKEFLVHYKEKLNPLIYDEMFYRVNNPSYSTKSLVSQNRLFLGFNLNLTKHSFWRIGYMNQYLTSAPHPHRRTTMNHLLVVSYTIGKPNISLPVDD